MPQGWDSLGISVVNMDSLVDQDIEIPRHLAFIIELDIVSGRLDASDLSFEVLYGFLQYSV
jgi:hypothetical protein